MQRAAFILLFMFGSSIALADVVTLNDGTKLEGDVKKTDRGWIITSADGKTIEVAASKVKSIQLGKDAGEVGSAGRAMSDLSSLRRAVENLADLNGIVERFTRFIETNKNTAAAEEAQHDLAVWQDRRDRGLVKLGNVWVTAQERTELSNRALAISELAREQIARGRYDDGYGLTAEALESDPACAPALYLRGIVEYERKKLVNARKSFEAVAGQLADHAPSLNNIAVILWRQNAHIPALSQYDRSMTASPVNKIVLDNVAEALAALPDAQRKNRIAQTLLRRFTEQDKLLQESLAAEGWYRWGGSWIDREAMQKLRDQEKEINDQVAAIRESVKEDRERLQQLDSRLEWVQARIHQIYMNTPVPFPGFTRMPFPPVYFELQEEEKHLQFARAGIAPKVEQADAEIQRLLAQLPQPKFTGTQKVIGVEGMPVIVQAPNSNPAPMPTPPPRTSKDRAGNEPP